MSEKIQKRTRYQRKFSFFGILSLLKIQIEDMPRYWTSLQYQLLVGVVDY